MIKERTINHFYSRPRLLVVFAPGIPPPPYVVYKLDSIVQYLSRDHWSRFVQVMSSRGSIRISYSLLLHNIVCICIPFSSSHFI